MRPEITLIKQSAFHSVGHIYEHIIADKINDFFMVQRYAPLLDYELNANTYDGIIVISVEAAHETMITGLLSILESVRIDSDDITAAVNQISSEYERLVQYDVPELLDEVHELHTLPWTMREDFLRSNPINDDARELNSKLIQFSNTSPHSFAEFSVTYRVKECPFDLKPLAVYLLQALALSEINVMVQRIRNCYDSGDEWAEYQDLVGYSHKFRMLKKDMYSIDELRSIEAGFREVILTSEFSRRLKNYLTEHAADPIPYFNTKNLYAYSYQVIGHRGWKDIVSDNNIDTILKKLDVEIW